MRTSSVCWPFARACKPYLVYIHSTNETRMQQSVRDIACIHNEATEEAETTCEWCRSIINYEPNKGWNVHLTASEHERAIALFGGSSLTSRQRWRNLQSNLRDSPHVQWARLKSPTLDPIEALPCSEEEWRLLFETVQEGSTLSVEQEPPSSKACCSSMGPSFASFRTHGT